MVRPKNMEEEVFTGLRGRVASLVESPGMMRFISVLIILNAVTLGLETDSIIMEHAGHILHTIDKIVVAIFTLEILLKIFVYRLSFFREGWNVFDFIVVGISLLPSSGPLAILRALRILRILRLMSVVPQMRRVISALFHAIPGMASIIAVLLIIFYVSAVLATKIFGAHPDPNMQEWFGTIGASMYSLFQIMTLEGWSDGIVRPVMHVMPLSWIFFIPFVIITSFAVLNLFIGIIVDAMQQADKILARDDLDNVSAVTVKETDEVVLEVQALRKEIRELKEEITAGKKA